MSSYLFRLRLGLICLFACFFLCCCCMIILCCCLHFACKFRCLYQPYLQSGDGPIVLVLAPTRELAMQIKQVNISRSFSEILTIHFFSFSCCILLHTFFILFYFFFVLYFLSLHLGMRQIRTL